MFQHSENETADQTIIRFEQVVKVCDQQGVRSTNEGKIQSLLSRPNERYKVIRELHLGTDIEEVFTSLRHFDDDFQTDATPASGSVARVEGRCKTVDTKSFADTIADGISEGIAKAEIIWAQKYAKAGSKSDPSTSRGAASYTICYCCNEKGHYSRDCPELQNSKCNYYRKDGHLEKACKLKREREPAAGGNRGEVSFFHGGGGMAEEGEINIAS